MVIHQDFSDSLVKLDKSTGSASLDGETRLLVTHNFPSGGKSLQRRRGVEEKS